MSNSPETGTEVILPVAVRRFHGASSLVSIQNVDRAETARVTASTVDYRTGIRADVLDSMVRPGHSIRLDFDVDLAVMGDGFLGALAIEANVGDAPAEVVIRFSRALPVGTEEPVVCESDCRAVIPPKHMHAFWPPAMGSLPSGTYGSAMVESTKPVAVVVNAVPGHSRRSTSDRREEERRASHQTRRRGESLSRDSALGGSLARDWLLRGESLSGHWAAAAWVAAP